MSALNYINEGVFAIIQIAWAIDQKRIFEKNLDFDHKEWDFWCVVAIALLSTISLSWILAIALACFRIFFFAPFLNLIRNRSFWFLDITDPKGSEWDKNIYPYYKEIWFTALGVFIFLQFFL